jgi:hypothetical protein
VEAVTPVESEPCDAWPDNFFENSLGIFSSVNLTGTVQYLLAARLGCLVFNGEFSYCVFRVPERYLKLSKVLCNLSR